MKIGFIVRLSVVALSFAQGALTSQLVAPAEGVSASMLVVVFLFGIVSMLFVVGMQRINPRSASVWRYPNWDINPFLLNEPLQFFHLGGYSFIAVGVGSALRLLVLGQAIPVSVMFAPAAGAGVLAGVYACTIVYRGKMERV
ncbi:hypothetical protein [Solimonas sp. SE-A11]|uniref:hypothetical protein n=1 Tax=Solimonas sp. SE-A11 TaxID=3054954 RepID=UPI00259D0CA2|nr:hypothetical protein [Solimonas sp. SE-A11]MDM4769972.1 hypothetical protein [Solimonas sp. SE-A11]